VRRAREQRQCAEPPSRRRASRVKEVSRPRGVRRERTPCTKSAKATPQRSAATPIPRRSPGPTTSPIWRLHACGGTRTPFPENECCEDEEQRQIEAAEDSRVPEREGGKGRPTRGQEPDFVPVPHWAMVLMTTRRSRSSFDTKAATCPRRSRTLREEVASQRRGSRRTTTVQGRWVKGMKYEQHGLSYR